MTAIAIEMQEMDQAAFERAVYEAHTSVLISQDGKRVGLGHCSQTGELELPGEICDVYIVCYPAVAGQKVKCIGDWNETTFCEASATRDRLYLLVYPAQEVEVSTGRCRTVAYDRQGYYIPDTPGHSWDRRYCSNGGL